MASELRVNSSTNRSGLGTITYTDSGPIVSGVGTFANGLTVDGTQTTVKSLKLTGDNYNVNWFKTSSVFRLNDNAKLNLGSADDMQQYHDGTTSWIKNTTGVLRIENTVSNIGVYASHSSGDIIMRAGGATSSENAIVAVSHGEVTLAFNGSTKLTTTNTGAVVSGILTATGNLHADNAFLNSGLTLNNNGNPAVNIISTSTTGSSRIFFGDPDSALVGRITYEHNGDYMPFYTAYGERLRIGSAGQLGIGGANYGSSGQVLTSGGSGSIVTWSAIPAQATIANNADNRVITGGSGVNLNGEQRLTWDGSQLYIDCQSYQEPILINSTQSSVRATIRQTNDANANSGLAIQKRHSSLHPANYWYGDIAFQGWDGSGYHRAGLIECVAEGTPANDNMPGNLRFSTNSGAASQTERFRITAGGQLRLMEGNNVKMSVYNDGSTNFITSNTGQEIKISCGNGDSNGIEFWDYTGGNKRCQIDGHGIKFNTDTAEANALNDYEEGDHDTTVTMSGDTSFSYSSRTLAYTKIGRAVFVTGRINMTGAGGSSFRFTLPFTCGDGSFKYETSNEFQNIRFNDGYTFRIRSNTAYMDLQSDGSDTGIGTGSPHINVNIFYFTA